SLKTHGMAELLNGSQHLHRLIITLNRYHLSADWMRCGLKKRKVKADQHLQNHWVISICQIHRSCRLLCLFGCSEPDLVSSSRWTMIGHISCYLAAWQSR